MFFLKIIGKKKHPNIPNNPQLFEVFTSGNSSNFPQLTKHPGKKTPKISPKQKKAKQPSRTLFVWAKTLRRKRDFLDCFFFAETEAMLSRNWLGNFRTRFGRFGFANYQVLPYSTCPNRFNSRFTKCHSAIVPCGSFHLYQVRRFAQDGQMAKPEASEVDLPCHGSTNIWRTYFQDLGPAWFEGGNQMSWWYPKRHVQQKTTLFNCKGCFISSTSPGRRKDCSALKVWKKLQSRLCFFHLFWCNPGFKKCVFPK